LRNSSKFIRSSQDRFAPPCLSRAGLSLIQKSFRFFWISRFVEYFIPLYFSDVAVRIIIAKRSGKLTDFWEDAIIKRKEKNKNYDSKRL
jgi:hypothetical protein